MGDVMSELQKRRMDLRGGYQIIKARTPLAELDKFNAALRSCLRHLRAAWTPVEIVRGLKLLIAA